MPLDRSAILQIEDRKLTKVTVPEWGGDVFIRVMSGAERDAFETEMIGRPASERMANMRARLVVRVVCDENGKRLFEDSDATAVGAKSAAALDRIFDVARGINRMGPEEVASAGKDSPTPPSGASGSGSPSPSGT